MGCSGVELIGFTGSQEDLSSSALPAQTHTSALLTEPALTERGDKALGDIPLSSVSGKAGEGWRHSRRQNAKAIKNS